ncbi:MAG: head-tail connector protein [Succinivibrio sp.]|nr:head-tail connector protein [Succinivibrio sp.]
MIYHASLPADLPVTVEECKAHLHIDHDLEDDLIKQYILAATQEAEHRMQREIIFRSDPLALTKLYGSVPEGVKQFIMVTVGDMFAHRENQDTGTLSTHFEHLLDPWIQFDREDDDNAD